jgi:lycopene beta-cyclase
VHPKRRRRHPSFVHAPPSTTRHITIVGGGPAAVALAASLRDRQHRVTLRAPGGLKAPAHTLCAFADQLADASIGTRFPRTLVVTDAGSVDLQRAYARFDDSAARASLSRTCTVIDGRVDGSTPLTGDDIVVDTTGHAPVLVKQVSVTPAWQSAFGLVIEGRDEDLPPGTALFMDWRDAGVDDGGPPSFLYALSGDDGRLLLEETTLASWAPVPTDLLRTRLRSRLRRRGTVIDRVVGDEVVHFPMGGGVPRRRQRVAAFGASLGVVSPVSGYSVARTISLVPVVADALVGADAAGAGDAVIDAVWTPGARSLRTLQRFALTAACQFNQHDAGAFFGDFFALPTPQWRGFLDGTDDVERARATMLALFSSSTASLRVRLMAGALTSNGLAVATDIIRTLVEKPFGPPARSAP